MSIWCSWDHVGTDPTVMYAVAQGLYEVDLGAGEQARGRKPVEQRAHRGNVLSFAEGFSNHYPDLTGSRERPACIALADIAPWCVPGHEAGNGGNCETCGHDHGWDDPREVGPWLRMEVAAPESLNFWRKDDEGNPLVEEQGATVVLDVAAVTALRDDLNEWLNLTHLAPTNLANPTTEES